MECFLERHRFKVQGLVPLTYRHRSILYIHNKNVQKNEPHHGIAVHGTLEEKVHRNRGQARLSFP